MNRTLSVIFMTIWLDAVGIGLIFPILPQLLKEVMHTADIAHYMGILAALYALMQFIFAPLLGALSDNFGRRPVLLVSLAGAVVNYLIMAFASHLWLLLLGRAIAGLTSANIAVAMAWMTDITPAGKRASRFGLFNATFGAGFIIGPVLGGVLGDYGVRLPFFVAAVLNSANVLLALFALQESRQPARQKMALAGLNPLRTLALAFLRGPATRLLGERGAILGGIACSSTAFIVLSLAQQSWIVFAVMPLLASIVAPLVFSSLYFGFRTWWPGAIWLSVVVLYVFAVPLIYRCTRAPS